MNSYNSMKSIFKTLRKVISLTLIAAFIGSSLYVPKAQAGEMVVPIIPKPGTMVNLSPVFTPAYLKGIVVHPDNALKFDFLVHKGNGNLDDAQKRQEYNKLIKYFLAALTVPDKDQWVNLSPYEKNRIVENDFGATEMGRDLLSQDYLLKQIISSLMYPESGLGKVFWDKVYERAYKEFGTTNIPVNTFNKVWIVPDEALIYESGNTAYVVKSHLKVMLEEDYLSLKKHSAIENPDPKQNVLHSVSSKIIKEVILPEIEREVNEGKNFAMLRQVFSGMVLATWYKMALKESLLGKVYADKAKVQGVDQDPRNNTKIYHEYLAAFKKGVYNFIKEDEDKYTNQVIPRKYFAGGFIDDLAQITEIKNVPNAAMSAAVSADGGADTMDAATVAIDQAQASANAAMTINDETPIEEIWSIIKKDPPAFLQQVQTISQIKIKEVSVLEKNGNGGGLEILYIPGEFGELQERFNSNRVDELTLVFDDDKDLPSKVIITEGEIGHLFESIDFNKAADLQSSVVQALEFVRDSAQLSNNRFNRISSDTAMRVTGTGQARASGRAITPMDSALVAPLYQNKQEMYERLPGDIREKLKEIGFLDADGVDAIMKLIDALEGIYKKMELTTENYHNHFHNMYVLYGSLILNHRAGLIQSKRDLIVTVLGALKHDFDVRMKSHESRTPNGTPALVEETLGSPPGMPQQGGQLRDLFGIGDFVYQTPVVPYTVYQTAVTNDEKQNIRDLYRQLTGAQADEMYAEVETVIRRTDFPSNVGFPNKHYKFLTDDVRDFMDRQVRQWVSDHHEPDDKDWDDLRDQVVQKYHERIFAGIDKPLNISNKPWVERQYEIEMNFFKSLSLVSPERRLKVYRLANRVELADQSGPTWLGTPSLNVEITEGLMKEQRVSVEGNYSQYYELQLLPDRVLYRLRDLPFEYRKNFVKNMEYFAREATKSANIQLGDPHLTSEQRSAKLRDPFFLEVYRSKGNWEQKKDNVLAQLHLYEKNNQIKEEPDEIIAGFVLSLMKAPVIEQNFNLEEIHDMASAKGMVERQTYEHNDLIIQRGDSSDDWFYIMDSGEARVLTPAEGKGYKDYLVGESFGEMATISRESRNADIRAMGKTTVLRLPGSALRALMLRNGRFRERLYQDVVPGRLRPDQREHWPSWAVQDIMMTMARSKDLQWQIPKATLGYPIPDYLEPQKAYDMIIAVLGKSKHMTAMRHIKEVVIVDAQRNERTPRAAVYEDPIDQKDFLVFSSKLFSGNITEFLDALDKALDKTADRALLAELERMPFGAGMNAEEFEQLGKIAENYVFNLKNNRRFTGKLFDKGNKPGSAFFILLADNTRKEIPQVDIDVIYPVTAIREGHFMAPVEKIIGQSGGRILSPFEYLVNSWMLIINDMPSEDNKKVTALADLRELKERKRERNVLVDEGLRDFVSKFYEIKGIREIYLQVQALERNRNPAMVAQKVDRASVAGPTDLGGIDLNSANLAMVIKRDGRGVPLPVSQQDMAQLARIKGFVPRILEIKPASSLPFLSDAK